MGESRVGDVVFTQWLQAVETVARRLERRELQYEVFEGVMVCGGICGFVFVCGESLYWLLLIPVLILPAIIAMAIRRFRKTPKNPRVDNTAPGQPNPARDARIAERLITREITGNEFSHRLSWPVNRLFRPLENPSREQRINRVLLAWDWYCGLRSDLGPLAPFVFLIPLLLILPALVFTALFGPDENWQWVFMMMIIAPGLQRYPAMTNEYRLETLAQDFRLIEEKPTSLEESSPEPASPVDQADLAAGPAATSSGLTPVDLNRLENAGQFFMSSLLHPQSIMVVAAAFLMLFAAGIGEIPVVIAVLPAVVLVTVLTLVFIPELTRRLASARACRQRIREALGDGDLLARITSGEAARGLSDLEISWIYKRLFRFPALPAELDGSKLGGIWLAVNNLDWVINPPREPERPWWNLTGLQIAGLIVLSVMFLQSIVSIFAPAPMPMPDFSHPTPDMFQQLYNEDPLLTPSPGRLATILVTMGVVLLCAIPGWLHYGTTIIWREELVAELRARLSANKD